VTGRLGLVTIGQSPRVDVLPDILPVLEGREWVEHGALDRADARELAEIAPHEGETPLVSRMRDGSRVTMAHARVLPLIVDAVARAAADGADAALLMCTGRFEPFDAPIPVHAAEPLAQERTVRTASGFGVLSPIPEQLADAALRWERRAGAAVPVAAADPYTATEGEIAQGARRLAARGVSSIVLDCFGYSSRMAAIVEDATGLPTHLTRIVATEAALERIDAR
jgi:protein AroM